MFASEILELNNNLDAIIKFVDFVEPLLEEQYKNNYHKNEDLFVLLYELDETEESKDIKELAQDEIARIEGLYDVKINISKTEDGNQIKMNGGGALEFAKSVKKMDELFHHTQLLYKSCLMNIISVVECYFGDIIKKYVTEYPHEITKILLKCDEKVISYKSLQNYSTIEEATNCLVENKIENIIRDSFLEWVNFLKTKMNLSMGYLQYDKQKIYEVFLRRNLFVHNRGVINSIYLSTVDQSLLNGETKEKQKIRLEKDYLLSSIELIETNFILITLEIWKSKLPNDEERFNIVGKLINNYISTKRWNVLKSISIFLSKDSKAPMYLKNVALINIWLSHKKLNDFDKVKKEVDEKDFSSSSVEFLLCKYALLDDKDKVKHYLKRVLQAKEFDANDIETNLPVLDDYIEDIEIQTIIDEFRNKQDEDIQLPVLKS